MLLKHTSIKAFEQIFGTQNLKSHYTLTQACAKGTVPAVKKNSVWYLTDEYVSACKKWWDTVVSIGMKINDAIGVHNLSEHAANRFRVTATRYLKEIPKTENEYDKFFIGPFVEKEFEEKVDEIIAFSLKKYLPGYISVIDAAKEMHISAYQLKEMLKDQNIITDTFAGQQQLDIRTFHSLQNTMHNYASVYDIICRAYTNLQENDIPMFFDIKNSRDRVKMNNHIKNSGLGKYLLTPEQVHIHSDRKNALYIPIERSEQLLEYVMNEIPLLGKRDLYFEKIMEHAYWDNKQETKQAILDFSESKAPGSMITMVMIIMEYVSTEFYLTDNNTLQELLVEVKKKGRTLATEYMIQFITYIQRRYTCTYSITNILQPEVPATIQNTQPYSLSQYMQMSYMVFSDFYISEHGLIEKALQNCQEAKLWLFSACMYICAWRASDLSQLPILPLPGETDDIIASILENSFTEKAVAMCDLLVAHCNNKKMRPIKTESKNRYAYLVLHIPESLKPIFGVIYTINLIHVYKDGVAWDFRRFTWTEYVRFYGSTYEKIFGQCAFSNRRANKSYMTQLSDIVNSGTKTSQRVLGYQIAAIARSHTGSIYQLPATTAIYLDYKMDGLSMNEIFTQLWENGICGFIPHMLLSAIYQDNYETLPFEAQTKIIKYQNLDAYECECISEHLRTAYIQASQVMHELFFLKDIAQRKSLAQTIITRMIKHTATAKDIDMHCLLIATDRACAYPARETCFGCMYSVAEKSMCFRAFQIIRTHFHKMHTAKTTGTRLKHKILLDNSILPATMELLTCLKQDYNVDISEYQNELIHIIKGESDTLCSKEENF